jgi:hypothetical protein
MYPSSSNSETGLASSASRRAVVCGEMQDGMRERSSPDEGPRDILGLCRASLGIRDIGSLMCVLGLTGRGAFRWSTSPMQHNRARLLPCFGGCGLRRSDFLCLSFSGSETSFRDCFRCSTSSSPKRSANESTLVRSRIVLDFSACGEAWIY